MEKKVQIKVEFEPTPIRHMAIQCPGCEKWFHQADIVHGDWIRYAYEIEAYTKCKCPVCGNEFDLGNVELDERVNFPEFYDKCAKKKVTVEWE